MSEFSKLPRWRRWLNIAVFCVICVSALPLCSYMMEHRSDEREARSAKASREWREWRAERARERRAEDRKWAAEVVDGGALRAVARGVAGFGELKDARRYYDAGLHSHFGPQLEDGRAHVLIRDEEVRVVGRTRNGALVRVEDATGCCWWVQAGVLKGLQDVVQLEWPPKRGERREIVEPMPVFARLDDQRTWEALWEIDQDVAAEFFKRAYMQRDAAEGLRGIWGTVSDVAPDGKHVELFIGDALWWIRTDCTEVMDGDQG